MFINKMDLRMDEIKMLEHLEKEMNIDLFPILDDIINNQNKSALMNLFKLISEKRMSNQQSLIDKCQEILNSSDNSDFSLCRKDIIKTYLPKHIDKLEDMKKMHDETLAHLLDQINNS